MGLLFERYHRDLFGYYYRITNDSAQSEDLIQNLFYRLLKYRHAFRSEGKFVYWMYAVAKNVSRDVFKKKDPMHYSDDVSVLNKDLSEDLNVEETIEMSDRKELLKRAMLKLSSDQRDAIVMSKFQGMKYQEIAIIARCTESAIKARIRRGLMDLKNIIQKAESR